MFKKEFPTPIDGVLTRNSGFIVTESAFTMTLLL